MGLLDRLMGLDIILWTFKHKERARNAFLLFHYTVPIQSSWKILVSVIYPELF